MSWASWAGLSPNFRGAELAELGNIQKKGELSWAELSGLQKKLSWASWVESRSEKASSAHQICNPGPILFRSDLIPKWTPEKNFEFHSEIKVQFAILNSWILIGSEKTNLIGIRYKSYCETVSKLFAAPNIFGSDRKMAVLVTCFHFQLFRKV